MPGGILIVVAVKAIENGSCVVYSAVSGGYVAGLGMWLYREVYECSRCAEKKLVTLLLPCSSAGERTWHFDLMIMQY